MASKSFPKQLFHHLTSLFAAAILATAIHRHHSNLHHLIRHNPYSAAAILTLTTVTILLAAALRPKKVYLVDFACYNHDPSFSITKDRLYEKMSSLMSAESLAFCSKVMDRSLIGDEISAYGLNDFPPKSKFACAREEAEAVIGGAVDDLLIKTGVDPKEIGVVVVNISTFNPVSSLSAMIVNTSLNTSIDSSLNLMQVMHFEGEEED